MYQTKLDTSALAWSPTGWPGVSMKMLHQYESTGGMSGMTRMAAGSSIPAHSHTHADQMVFVIEGDLVEDGVSYGPGSFLIAKAGTPHGPHASPGGCTLLTTYSGPPDFVPVG
ncbi:MAG TPA: cupin domain-containing protein [Tepidisphaeraceae bacterium]|jgi:quercetin dioxygenase-like cupin family protein|nr:cupin domain-containing protein [Tepidisphaeraceae bacterium]